MPTLQEITWPLEKRRRLEALWANDRSAAEIAEILGVTRNAVLGKIHRLKLAKRVNTVKRRSDRPVNTRIKKPVIKERKTVSPQEKEILNRGLLGSEAIFGGNGISLLAATSRHCAWPLEGKSLDGKSVKIEYMRKQAEKAKQQPSYENTFKRLHLNIWTEQEKRWLAMAEWDKGGPAERNLGEIANLIAAEEQSLLHRRCYGGLDLARVNDLSCLALVFPPLAKDEKWKALFRFWCPEDNISDDDDLIDGYISAARERAELFTRRRFITQQYYLFFDKHEQHLLPPLLFDWRRRHNKIRLPYPPLQTLDAFDYQSAPNVWTAVDSCDYYLDAPGRQVILTDYLPEAAVRYSAYRITSLPSRRRPAPSP